MTGVGGTRRFGLLDFRLVLLFPPHFFGLAQRNGVEPQRKTLLGWWRPREVSGPTRLSHSRGRCHSAAKVSASRTDCITRPKGEGLGSDVDWRLKVFCPAFLQKSGRGPGAEPWPRAAARGIPHRQRSAGGGQRGDPRRGSPLCGRPKPPAARATPRSRRWTKERVVEDADPYGGWETDRVPRDLLRGYPTPGRGLEERDKAGDRPTAGRRGRRPLRGGCGDTG